MNIWKDVIETDNALNKIEHSFMALKKKKQTANLEAQLVKNLPAVQETRVWSLGREDPLEKEMATHSSSLA